MRLESQKTHRFAVEAAVGLNREESIFALCSAYLHPVLEGFVFPWI